MGGVPYAIIVTTDTILGTLAWMWYRKTVHNQRHAYIFFAWTLLFWFLGVTAHRLGLSAGAGYLMAGGADANVCMSLSLRMTGWAAGFVPVILLSYTTVCIVANCFGRYVDGGEARLTADLSTARQLAKDGQYAEAVQAYKGAFRAFQEDPSPLFAAASLESEQGHVQDALASLRYIMKLFQSDDVIWVKAANGVCELLREHMDDSEELHRLEAAIAHRRETQIRNTSHVSGQADLNQARAHQAHNRTDDALKRFRMAYDKNPDRARPLFEAATYLEREERYTEARDQLSDIISRFKENDKVWAEASLRLANLLNAHFDEPSTRIRLFKNIASRCPASDAGRLARKHLIDLEENH